MSGSPSSRISVKSRTYGTRHSDPQPQSLLRQRPPAEALNIPDPYSHPDFNVHLDRQTGYRTRSILCMPILDRNKNVFAVAQMLNKNGGEPFTAEDEVSFREFAKPLGLILESCLQMAKAPVPK